MTARILASASFVCLATAVASATPVTVNYAPFQVNSGSGNANARATGIWDVSGTTMTIRMQNTSITPNAGADDASWLLATINFALPSGVSIDVNGTRSVTGGTAVNSPGTRNDNWGLKNGTPSTSDTPNASSFRQVITTLNGDYNGGSAAARNTFSGNNVNLAGPDGGILPNGTTAGPKNGWHNFLLFSFTLTGSITQAQLETTARGSNVTFNSHGTFLSPVVVPAPLAAMATLAGLGLVAGRRRRTA